MKGRAGCCASKNPLHGILNTSPDLAVEAVYDGDMSRKRVIVLTAVGKLSDLLCTMSPALYDRIVTRNSTESEEEL